MRTSTVGLPRASARVKPPRVRPSNQRAARRTFRPGRAARAAIRPVQRRVGARLGVDAAVPAVVAAIIAIASLVSWLPGMPARGAVQGPVGGPSETDAPLRPVARPDGARSLPGPGAADAAPAAVARPSAEPARPAAPRPMAGAERGASAALDLTRIDPDAIAAAREAAAAARASTASGPFLDDGTLLKPAMVDTTVADGRHLLKVHRIAKGDSLLSIAERYNVSMMTIWWANDLRSQNLLVGKTLRIPLVDGLVHTVAEGDTLDSLAAAHDVDAGRIEQVNELDDPVLVAGQTLILPGAAGEPIPEPTPPPAPEGKVGPEPDGTTDAASGPAAYGGGRMVWPVIGGNQFVSRGFRGGHQGLDVAADSGTRVVAAAAGTVVFAGWKANGGGYQVWIAHGSGIHTTYSHLSAVSVGNGQSVGAGQLVGRVGDSGYSTGPHLHFEVWHGAIWSGGARVNPMSHL